jgi:hypothetical protein
MNKFHYEKINTHTKGFNELLAWGIRNPTLRKISAALKNYAQPGWHTFGCSLNGDLIGLIGIELCPPIMVVKTLSVLPTFRLHGIATKLLEVSESHLLPSKVFAEVDEYSLNFFQKRKFKCSPFKVRKGRTSFLCERDGLSLVIPSCAVSD